MIFPAIQGDCTSSFPSRRSASVPNPNGTKALYTARRQASGNQADIVETRVFDFQTKTSVLFSNDPRIVEARWLGLGNQVVWLKMVDFGATEIWIADADITEQTYVNLRVKSNPHPPMEEFSVPVSSHCAGRINGRATHLKVHPLRNQYYDDIAIAVACPASQNGEVYKEISGRGQASEVRNTIWYTTLRKKAMTNDRSDPSYLKYIVSPTRFVNALKGTGLECPSPSPIGAPTDFDISTSGIVFLGRNSHQDPGPPNVVDTYYLPLKTFTEMVVPRPQIIRVKGLAGRSSNPIFSPTGDSVAFLKKQHPTDLNDRNRVVVINKIREFKPPMAMNDMPTHESEKAWHLSPHNLTWSEDGKNLHVVAIEEGVRKLYKLPATLSSIKATPEAITNDGKTLADVQHMRTVFSAPMVDSFTSPTVTSEA